MESIELNVFLDLFKNKNYATDSAVYLDLLLFLINNHLKGNANLDTHNINQNNNNNHGNHEYNDLSTLNNTISSIFYNFNNQNGDNFKNITYDFDSYPISSYTKLFNEILNRNVIYSDIKYVDLLASSILDEPLAPEKIKYIKTILSKFYLINNSLENFQDNRQTSISNFKTLIKRLELLIYDSYQNLMNIYAHNLIDLGILFNSQHITIIMSYFTLFSEDKNLNRKDYWNLLDISLNYINQINKFINIQLNYYQILVNNFHNFPYDNIFSVLNKQKKYLKVLLQTVSCIIGKIGIHNPHTIEEFRIFYNVYQLLNSDIYQGLIALPEISLFNTNNHVSILKFKQLNVNNIYSEELSEAYINVLTKHINHDKKNKRHLLNYDIIIENANILLNEKNYINIEYNLATFDNINDLFEKIINNKLIKYNEKNNNLLEIFKNNYYNFIFHLLDKISISSTRLIKFGEKYNSYSPLIYIDYQIFMNDIFYIEHILGELDKITYIILNDNSDNNLQFKFGSLQIDKYILTIFRLYSNKNFNNIFSNTLKKNSFFMQKIKSISNKILYNNFNKLKKSKNNTWYQIITYLELPTNHNKKLDLINNLVQNKFNYLDLEKEFRNSINKSWMELFEKYSDNEYQEKLDKCLEEFGDPITNEMIVIPITLPLTGQIVDKDVILQILQNNPINPFNNMPLTIKDLEEYNQKPEIKEQNLNFLQKLQKIKEELNDFFCKSIK